SFLGLAILTLLYFSQARDVRRLREWAGRAPERASEPSAAQHYLPPTTIQQASQPRARPPLRERLRRIHVPQARYIAMAVGALVILAGAGFGAVQLIGNDSSGTAARNASDHSSKPAGGRDKGGNRAAKISP